jgi:MerR family transcriptional regulator, copper efflux regulator
VAELLITELSRVSGFPSSALRYYERVGLLAPVGRSPGGYRLYDAGSVDRLAFIGRAKRLGLSLDEISDLVELWEEGPCAPVQTRLTALVDDKVARLDAQIHDLTRFRAQLEHVQRSLVSAEPADRCGPGCGCDAELECTLSSSDVPERLREWEAVLDRVEQRRVTPLGISLRFPRDAALLGSVADLAARELACCSFFTFALTLDAKSAWLAIGAPADAVPMVIDLFGPKNG